MQLRCTHLWPEALTETTFFRTEVPLEVGVQEGHHKAARGSVHVDLDVPAVLLIQLTCKHTLPIGALTGA